MWDIELVSYNLVVLEYFTVWQIRHFPGLLLIQWHCLMTGYGVIILLVAPGLIMA